MPDERTVSDFTRINTRLRSHQEVRTLVDMTQIRQWERYNPEQLESFERPTVKFCDLDQDIFGTAPLGKTPVASKLHKTRKLGRSVLIIEDDDEGMRREEITSDETKEWMDEALPEIEGMDKFELEADFDLDTTELTDILADVPRINKGKEKATNVVSVKPTESESEDDEVAWVW